jgi:general secretion pathway protein E
MIEIDDSMRQMIYESANEQDILVEARRNYPGIESDGRRRILAGETSIEEVMRVTSIA